MPCIFYTHDKSDKGYFKIARNLFRYEAGINRAAKSGSKSHYDCNKVNSANFLLARVMKIRCFLAFILTLSIFSVFFPLILSFFFYIILHRKKIIYDYNKFLICTSRTREEEIAFAKYNIYTLMDLASLITVENFLITRPSTTSDNYPPNYLLYTHNIA